MKNIIFYAYAIACASLPTSHITAQNTPASWTFFIYMEASEQLQHAAIKNLNELTVIDSDHVNIFVLLHADPRSSQMYLYKIEKQMIKQLQSFIIDQPVSTCVVNTMHYIVEQAPADNYALILWDHGFGILDPRFDRKTQSWEVQTHDTIQASLTKFLLKKHKQYHNNYHRGMLLNAHSKLCMTNQDMIDTFEQIHTRILHGKKIALCGLDMCKGAMLEHAYQLRHYVDYLISSQECELSDGWPYHFIMEALSHAPFMDPRAVSHTIIDAYQAYYEQKTHVSNYTLSVVDMHNIELLKQNIDTLISYLTPDHASMIYHTRDKCSLFCEAPMYIDLHEWYSHMQTYLQQSHDDIPDKQSIEKIIKQGKKIIRSLVCARCSGKSIPYAHGLSVYFPQNSIDQTYVHTPFAQETQWISMLNAFMPACA